MIPTLLGTSIIIFVLFALLPGDYIDSNPKITPERATELRELYGLNKPIVERYFHWLGNALQGLWLLASISRACNVIIK